MLQRLKIVKRFCEEYTLDEIEDYWYGLLKVKDLTSREHFYQEIRFIMESVEPLDWEYWRLAIRLEEHIVKNYHAEDIDHHYFILKEFQERGLACDNLSIKITQKIQDFHDNYSHIYWYMISEAALYRDHTESQLMFQPILFKKALEHIILEIDEYDMCFIAWAIGKYSHIRYYLGLSEFMDRIIQVVFLRIQLFELQHYKLLLEYQLKSHLTFYLHLYAEFISNLEEFTTKQLDEIIDILKMFFKNPHSFVYKTHDNVRSAQITILSAGDYYKINKIQFEELSWIFHGYAIVQYYEEYIFEVIKDDPHDYPITISWLLFLGLLDDNNVTDDLINKAYQDRDVLKLYHFYYVTSYFEDFRQVNIIENMIKSIEIDSDLPIRDLIKLLLSYSDMTNEMFTQQALNYIEQTKNNLDDITEWDLQFILKLAINNTITSALIDIIKGQENQDLLLRMVIILTKEFLPNQAQKLILTLLEKIEFDNDDEFFDYFQKKLLNSLRFKDFFLTDMSYKQITDYYISRLKKANISSFIVEQILSFAQFLSQNQSENQIQRNTIKDIVQICLDNQIDTGEKQKQNMRIIFHLISKHKLPFKDIIIQNIDNMLLSTDTQVKSLIYIYDQLSKTQHQQLMKIYNDFKNKENWVQLQLLLSMRYSDVQDDIKQVEQQLNQQGEKWMTQYQSLLIIQGFNIKEIKNNLPAYYSLLKSLLEQINSNLFNFDQDDWIHILHQFLAVGYKDEQLFESAVYNFPLAPYISGDNILKLLKCLQQSNLQELTKIAIIVIQNKYKYTSFVELYYPTLLQLIYQQAITCQEAQSIAQKYTDSYEIHQEQLKSLIQINCLFELQLKEQQIDNIYLNYLVVLYYQKIAPQLWFTNYLQADKFIYTSQESVKLVGEVFTIMGLNFITNKMEKDIIYDFHLPDNDQYILLIDYRYQEMELFIDYLIDKLANRKPVKLNFGDLLQSQDKVKYFIEQGIMQSQKTQN